MRYWQPFGISNPDAPYIDADPTIGQEGSIPPAGCFEQPQRELVNLIKASGINPAESSVLQLLEAARSQAVNYAAADPSTSENVVKVVFNPPIANNRRNGMPLRLKAAKTNTGPVQIDCDGVIAPLRRADTAELIANDLRAATVFECLWNDTFWAMTNYRGLGGGSGGTSNTYITKIPYAIDTGTVANTMLAAFAPAITSLVPGDAVEVKLAHTITGPTTLKVNAMAPVAVVRGDGSPLKQNDAAVGQIMLLMYTDANNFQFTGIIPSAFSGFGVPIGCIILALGSTAPPGTLKINGAMLNRSEHPALWAYANASSRIVSEANWQNISARNWTSFSLGDGIATFRLPDFRGEFMRFFDDGRGVDARLLTVQQADAVGAFSFTGNILMSDVRFTYYSNWPDGLWHPQQLENAPGISWFQSTYEFPSGGQYLGVWGNYVGSKADLSAQVSMSVTGGTETRPRNTPVVPCIVDG